MSRGRGVHAPDRIAHSVGQGVGLRVSAVRVLGAVGLVGDAEQAGHRGGLAGPGLDPAAVESVGVVRLEQAVVFGNVARGNVEVGVLLDLDLGPLLEQRGRARCRCQGGLFRRLVSIYVLNMV